MKLCVVKNRDIALTETFIRAQIEGLPAEVAVIHGSPPRLEQSGGEPRSIPLHLRMRQRVFRRFKAAKPMWGKQVEEYTYLLRKSGAEIVLAQYGTTGVIVMEACERLRIPLVVHFHGYDASRSAVLEEFEEAYRLLFEQAAALVVVSRAMRERVLALGAPPEKVILNPYGVVPIGSGEGTPASFGPVFLAVGRLVEKKAPHLLLLAFAEVHRRCPEARLRLIGDGNLMGVVQDLVAALGLRNAVDVLGAKPHDIVLREMLRARAFVQHSVVAASGDSEGTPVSILEAGACGLPVVSTHHAGIPDAVADGETGFVVPERDVHAMAERMLVLAENPDLATRMGRAARQRIRALYNREDRLRRLGAVLEAAHQRRPMPPDLLRNDPGSRPADPVSALQRE